MASQDPRRRRRRPRTYEEKCQLVSAEFEDWRLGGIDPIWTATEIHDYKSRWEGRHLPRSGQPIFWGGGMERYPWSQGRYHVGQKVVPPNLQDTQTTGDSHVENAKKRYREANEYFEENANKFTFKKVLGFGGLGLALHFKQFEGEESVKDIAVKLSLNSWIAEDIRFEERATRAMQGAAHCIQLIHPPTVGLPEVKYRPEPDDRDSSDDGESSGDESIDEEFAPPPRRPRSTLTQGELNAKLQRRDMRLIEPLGRSMAATNIADGERKDYMLLEYVEGGNLVNLIDKLQQREKASGEPVVIPNRVLWAIWLCLVRACVAMKYPPRKFHPDRRTRRRPNGRTDLNEMIPPQNKRWRQKNWVHFDIDPSNIFIGNIEAPPPPLIDIGQRQRDDPQPDREPGEHSFIPRIKLADFGLAEPIKTHKRNEYYSCRRQNGKVRYYAPEQFAAEWDQIPPVADGAEAGERRVPGVYGSPMNVYQMALTFWVVITQRDAPIPVEPQPPLGMVVPRLENRLVPSYLDNLIGPDDRISYCPYFMDPDDNPYEYVDAELRRTIYECMYHRQDDRPTVETLLPQAQAGVQKEFQGESDDFIKEWVSQFILDAPV
ncbi:kinase-like protein [Annulohypoxylon maeteangense]|uniref:kinase-like protein n=1 Tax=Annulohypoxylon maeteangense TaxID=1927788 RepID=UPI00200747CA|nr:kinase-like protein [Annulohypoxylon maeteangense]KAI0886530.1 kinase-like protein [Annulohypoxylon maeteangense]